MRDRPIQEDGFASEYSNTDTDQRNQDQAHDRAADSDGLPTAEEVRAQLGHIVWSREFRKSRRSQQFLQYVVDCALRGDTQRLKESVIGLEVFGRAPGYDRAGDSTVRVRASDVRRRLSAYYQRVADRAQVQIELPSGSYTPRFHRLRPVGTLLASGETAGQRLRAHPFPPLRDARLHQFHDAAAGLHVDVRHEPAPGTGGASPKTAGTPDSGRPADGDGPEANGSEILYSLIAHLVRAMDGDCGYVGTVTTDDVATVRAVAVVADGQLAENFEYALAGSPCERVIGKTVLICPEAVQRAFPGNRVLQERDAESYAGTPLFDCRGGSLGLLVVLSGRPLRDTQLTKSILEVYAARIAAELERKIAEHTLHVSEQRYRALFESAGDAILLMRGDRFVDGNRKALWLLGCAREQLMGRTPSAFAPPRQPDGRDSVEVGLEKTERAGRGEVVLFDWRVERGDGSVVDTQVTLTRVDDLGAPHLLAHVRDVSDSKEVEKRLRESEERFRAIFGGAGIGMAVVDLAGRIVESNPALYTLLGYNQAEVAGRSFADFSHPDDIDGDMRLFRELLEGKRDRYQIEKRYIHKNGQVLWGKLTASLVRNPQGEPQYCVRIAEDITERKRAEEARKTSEYRFGVLFHGSPYGYYLLDRDGVCLDANRSAELVAGCRKEELIGKTWGEAGLLLPEELEKAADLVARGARERLPEPEEFRLVRKDGGTVDVEAWAFPIESPGNEVVLVAVQDITRRTRTRASPKSTSTIPKCSL